MCPGKNEEYVPAGTKKCLGRKEECVLEGRRNVSWQEEEMCPGRKEECVLAGRRNVS
jgi:hypothetical protein